MLNFGNYLKNYPKEIYISRDKSLPVSILTSFKTFNQFHVSHRLNRTGIIIKTKFC